MCNSTFGCAKIAGEGMMYRMHDRVHDAKTVPCVGLQLLELTDVIARAS